MLLLAGLGGAVAAWVGRNEEQPSRSLPAAEIVRTPAPATAVPNQPASVAPARGSTATAVAHTPTKIPLAREPVDDDGTKIDEGALRDLLAKHPKDRDLIVDAVARIATGDGVEVAERKRLAVLSELLGHALNRLPMQTIDGRRLQTRQVKAWLLASRALQSSSSALAQEATDALAPAAP